MSIQGSITKQIVAATALKLHRQGDLQLEMPICGMLATPCVGERVTLAHLLSHTSGIVYDVGIAPEPLPTLAAVVAHAAMGAQPPGNHWFYCNTNYYLAGRALERRMGVPLSELVQEIIPGDLRSSFVFDGKPGATSRAAGHVSIANGVGTVAPPDGRSFGSGSAYATATMLVDWTTRLWSGEILSTESLELMSRRTVLPDGTEADYGMGCFSSHSGIVEPSHDGNTAGFSSQVTYYPEP